MIKSSYKQITQEDGKRMYKLLVVDDEMKIRDVIREYAEFNGYEVSEAEDGMQAVKMCREEDFDLIILDIMMPKLDGRV